MSANVASTAAKSSSNPNEWANSNIFLISCRFSSFDIPKLPYIYLINLSDTKPNGITLLTPSLYARSICPLLIIVVTVI